MIGDVGEQIIVQSDEFGEFKCPLVEVVNRGFRLEIKATDEERDRLVSKLDWYDKHINDQAPNRRKHKRVVPREPLSTLILATAARRHVSSSTCRRQAPLYPPTLFP